MPGANVVIGDWDSCRRHAIQLLTFCGYIIDTGSWRSLSEGNLPHTKRAAIIIANRVARAQPINMDGDIAKEGLK